MSAAVTVRMSTIQYQCTYFNIISRLPLHEANKKADSLTLALDGEHELSLIDVFDEFMRRPVVALGTDRPVQLQGVGVEAEGENTRSALCKE